MSSGSFQLQFERKNQLYSIDFQEQPLASEETVQLNGRNFKLLGDSSKIEWLQSKLPELNQHSELTKEDLQNRLIELGAKNITASAKTHALGMDSLQGEKPDRIIEKLHSALNQMEELNWDHIGKLLEQLTITDPLAQRSILRDAALLLREEKPKISEFILQNLVETALVPRMGKTGPSTELATIQGRMKELGIKGCSIAVVDTDPDGKMIAWSQGYGEMKSSDTRSQAASCSKTIAALTVLTLVEEGKLDLDTDVSTIIPKDLWKSIDPDHLTRGKSHKVTVRRLLSHTAGVSVSGFSGYSKSENMPMKTEDIILGKSTNSEPIRIMNPPGEGFDYSGGGTTLLQMVVEITTGQTFAEATEERVLKKLGMDSSSYSPPQENGVIGYRKGGDEVEGGWNIYPEQAAAGLWTTSKDLSKVIWGIQHAFNGGKDSIISQKLGQEMLTPQMEGHGAPNGLGLFVDKLPDLPQSIVFHHAGENQGYRSVLIGNGKGQGVAILTNSDDGKFLWKEIAIAVAETYNWPEKDHLMMAQPEIDPHEVDKIPPNPKPWGEVHKGKYLLQDPRAAVELNISLEDGRIFGQIDQESSFEIFPLSGNAAGYRRLDPGPWEVLRITNQGVELGGEKWSGKWMTRENAAIEANRKAVSEKYWSTVDARFKKIAKAEQHIARLKTQAEHTKKGKRGRSKKSTLMEQIKIHEAGLIPLRKQDTMLLDFLKSQSESPHEIERTFNQAIRNHDASLFYSLFENLSSRQLDQINRGEGLQAIPEAPLTDLPITLTDENIQDIQEYMRDSKFSGVIALSDGKGVPKILTSGEIKDSQAPFAIHSVGKLYTGVLVLRLIEEGILSEEVLKEPIKLGREVIDSLPHEVREQLSHTTLSQVMLHQGRYGDYLGNYQDAIEKALKEERAVPKIEKPEDFLQFADEKLVQLGPSGDAYSNLGLLLVGLSLQHLCNTPYQELLTQYVLEPAGVESFDTSMPTTACVNPEDPVAPHIAGGPAGGYWTTTQDLLKMGLWLKEKCSEEKFMLLVQKNGGEFYENGEIGHGGSIHSSSAHLTCRLSNGLTIAIGCNKTGPGEASAMAQAIIENILSPQTQIDGYLKSLEQSIQFCGSVLVKKDGQEILSKAYGQASEKTKNTSDTVFQIMSVSKQFTAAAIFKLLETIEIKEGRKIDVASEKITNYLPERFRSEKFKDITFKELLTHTSGLINNIEEPKDLEKNFEKAREQALSEEKPFEPNPDELVSFFIDNPIREEYKGLPHYSNNGYFLLGLIIEKMSGETYGDFIKNHLLPEEMNSTGYYNDRRKQTLSQAQGFGSDPENESLKRETLTVAGEAYAAGGLYSTPRDLSVWMESLLNGNIVTGEHLKLMTTRQAEDYSCGLEIKKIDGREAIFQGGTLPGGGFKAEMCHFKDSDDSVILFLNNFDVPMEHVRNTVLGILNNDLKTEKILSLVPSTPSFPEGENSVFDTKEKNAPHRFLKEGNQFFVIGPGKDKNVLVPLDNGRFLNIRWGVQWEFQKDRAIFYPREGDPVELPLTS